MKEAIHSFAVAAVKFHHRQDKATFKDAMKVRKINDQLMLLERTWVDSSASDKRHIILSE